GLAAAIENSARREVADAIRERVPPLRTLAAHLIELEHAVRLAPAGVIGDAASGDQRPGAFVDDAARLVLVHPEEDEVAGEVARLRGTANDRPLDRVDDWVRRALVISEERCDVAERRGASAENIRVGHRIDELVQLRGIEGPASPEADPDRPV